jgi:uncharacterized protein YjbJ (UPF0337 family)
MEPPRPDVRSRTEAEEDEMADKANELRGNIKEGAGKLLDNEQMEAEGKAEKEAAVARRRTEGAADEAKGHVKSAVGDLTDNEQWQAEGEADKLKGKAKRA